MKTSYLLFVVATAAFCLTACDEEEQFDKELYKKVIYVLSDEDLTFSVNHDLKEEETTGYISINCGGTNHIDKDVMVELEPDKETLARYNKLNYDLDESKYAHELDPQRYDIPDMTTILKANSRDTYSTIPVHVRPEGLSPDSIYLIPLRIKSVSEYEINPDKRSILYRVLLKNDYASQSPATYYQVKGLDTSYKEDEIEVDKNSTFSLSRIVAPLTKNSVRCFVGMNTYEIASLTEEAIQRHGMRITVNEEGALSLNAVGSAQIEMLSDSESNFYQHYDTSLYQYQTFSLHYRYRILKEGCDGSNGEADYDNWHEMKETMTRNVLIQ